MPELSVILCTHNPRADYLQRTLDALKAQTLSMERWEFLLIDNASKEKLDGVYDLTWHPRGRCVCENELGLTYARQRGISESLGEWLVFVDDDNVLAPDFLEKVLTVAARHPYLGVIGAGILTPEFETPPPPEIARLSFLLALRQVSSARWSNHPKDADCLPFGAGMCASRDVARRFVQFMARLKTSMVIGRKGTQLFSGEDDLFSWVATESGKGFGIFPELRITHLISAGRLNQRYFLRLMYYSAFSRGILHYLLLGVQPEKSNFFHLIRMVLHGLRNGRFSMRCQWAMARGEHGAADFISENHLRPVVTEKIPQPAFQSHRDAGPTVENNFGPTAQKATPSKKFLGIFTRRERWGISGRGWLVLLVTMAAAGILWVLSIHPFLATTQRTDAKILVVEGWVHEYALTAAAVEFRSGGYEKVFATGGPITGSDGATNDYNTSASVGADRLVRLGLAADKVEMAPSHIAGRDRTYSSAVALREWFRTHHMTVSGINVLTEDAHARRTRLLFQEAFGRKVPVGIIAVANPDYEPSRWWRYSEGVREILGESIAYVYARFFFHPTQPPEQVP